MEQETLSIQFDGFYRSEVQSHVRFEDGRRKEEEYYLYYKFLPEGVWVCKTTGSSAFRMNAFLNSIDMDRVLVEPDHDEPLIEGNELFYQCGRFETGPGFVKLIWKNSMLDEKERSWKFYLIEPDWLETEFAAFGLEYRVD